MDNSILKSSIEQAQLVEKMAEMLPEKDREAFIAKAQQMIQYYDDLIIKGLERRENDESTRSE